MSVKVQELMSEKVVTVQPHHTVAQIREKLTKRKLTTMPVVSENGEPIGMVAASDLIATEKKGTPASSIMTEKVYTIPEYEDVSVAARVMRNHKIHHLVVTREKKVVGVISSFDLLKLVEGHRFVMKNAPTSKNKGRGKRAKAELSS